MAQPPHPLATLAQILTTPSQKDGLPSDVEADLRVVGCMMIQEAGIMLELPQSTIATAQVLLNRFYYVSSMLSFGVNDISISALYLSSKLNETPVRLRDLINTYIFLVARINHLLSLHADQPLASPSTASSSKSASKPWGDEPEPWRIGLGNGQSTAKGKDKAEDQDGIWKGFRFEVPGFHDEVFWDWKDVIVGSEMQILKRLGFNMQVDLPYSHVINYCKILDLVFEPDVAQTCWSILNDALLTPLYAIHQPHTLACASILLSTRLLRIPLPKDWWILFDVEWDDIWSCAGTIMRLWHDWGLGPLRDAGAARGPKSRRDEPREAVHVVWEKAIPGREARWRRAWILSQGRKVVRKWVEGRDKS
ncbi:putative cyclin-dependent protein kinase regulator [Kockovaella imperatae]|uniref:Putative cyclin-dependent protein kinase regulator n=1 Tax=Kockovaella imperatae TaxID=4999 RepID=A0A1Y1UKN5_9TREE|nr:putative cyclin-dependent protein kinase regulator [Kockovaella imperatae]ORX38608.1 putative cyclin-dependent protein kinase regulator [Kockovaella imperatae]